MAERYYTCLCLCAFSVPYVYEYSLNIELVIVLLIGITSAVCICIFLSIKSQEIIYDYFILFRSAAAGTRGGCGEIFLPRGKSCEKCEKTLDKRRALVYISGALRRQQVGFARKSCRGHQQALIVFVPLRLCGCRGFSFWARLIYRVEVKNTHAERKGS